jgi:cell division protein FtsL
VARFHRETDGRLRRAMGVAVLCAAVGVAAVLGVVGLKVEQLGLGYRLDALRTARVQAEETNRRLRVELASLRSLARIEDQARTELGMVPPAGGQVLLAREYVAGSTGLARAGEPRTAAVPSGPPRLPLR